MIQAFAAVLPKDAQVLVAGFADDEGRDIDCLRALGIDAKGFDPAADKVERAQTRLGPNLAWRAELFFAKLERESWDGIWVNNSLTRLQPDACRRAMALFFNAIRPGGHLCVIFEEPDEANAPDQKVGYTKDDFASLVRQHGFTLLGEARNPSAARQVGLLARRIGAPGASPSSGG